MVDMYALRALAFLVRSGHCCRVLSCEHHLFHQHPLAAQDVFTVQYLPVSER